ncbi:UPF0262 family protein [uncultured Parasphingopyxis sp.]|uniref:UPF0262 family protein n=1 Tax=uncultured Parasphingopyxis sp. TaxID=1547918 RepID=UPI00262B9439|nr:UPF0262 family protein [uncultured Parasphingopyxis sp.]
MNSSACLCSVEIDEGSLAPVSAESEHERKIAIFDLLEENRFAVVDAPDGPYALKLSLADNRLVFDVTRQDGEPVRQFLLSLTPLRRLIKDYFLICDSYYDAIRSSTPAQIEAIDMGRRGLHNEGSEILIERLSGKVETDFDTARRLFTLVCALHMRN